jgi:myo-inositol-1(or 4)-monophosphatase
LELSGHGRSGTTTGRVGFENYVEDAVSVIEHFSGEVVVIGHSLGGSVAYAAAGRFDLYVHHYVQPWDIAPGLLLVREAGGIATDLRGAPAVPSSGCIVAAAPTVTASQMATRTSPPFKRPIPIRSGWRLS